MSVVGFHLEEAKKALEEKGIKYCITEYDNLRSQEDFELFVIREKEMPDGVYELLVSTFKTKADS